MVCRGFSMLVELLEVLDEVVYTLGIEELRLLAPTNHDLVEELPTFLMTCDGSVLSIARMYCTMAPS